MAGRSHFIWIPLLLFCVFQASDHRHVDSSLRGNPELQRIISNYPITLPEGIDPSNVNVTVSTVIIKTCSGFEEELTKLQTQLRQVTYRNFELDNEAFELRRDARKLKQQLVTCSFTASFSYQIKLRNEMYRLLETFDSDSSLILKIIALTSEVNTAQKKVYNAANSTVTATELLVLQRELQEKINELNVMTQQIERSHRNPSLILKFISLQHQIWDLEQADLRRGENHLLHNRNILDLQMELDNTIRELRSRGDADSEMLALISVQSKITMMQRIVSSYRERNMTTDYQGQLTTDSQIREIQVILAEEIKKQEILKKRLGTAQGQLIIKVINMLKEVREVDEHTQTTSTSQTSTLQFVLESKTRELAKAQAEIIELQRKLRTEGEECSGLEKKYQELKTEFELKIAELNRTGASKEALILSVINLHYELKTLSDRISTTEDQDTVFELKKELEVKQRELTSKTEDIERLIANPKTILRIIVLQNEIWGVQQEVANETTSSRLQELQTRLDRLMSEIDDNDNTKLTLNIIALQGQVELLQRQLADLQMLHTTRVTQLRNELTAKKKELQIYVNKLNERDQTNAGLILSATDLQNQLRILENKRHNDNATSTYTITMLRIELEAKVEEHSRDQAEIKALQNKLNQTLSHCSSNEQEIEDLQNDLDAKMKELQSKSNTITSLALQVSTLTLQVEGLKTQLQNSVSEDKVKELQKIIDDKTNELFRLTEELKARSAQPQRFLQIIVLQTEIERLVNVAKNDTDYSKIRGLEQHLRDLIDGVKDENDEYTKQMFKLVAEKEEIGRLKRQLESQTKAALERIKDLEYELEDFKNQIKEKTLVLDSSDTKIDSLSAQIMELQKKVKTKEDEISYLKEENAENLRELQERLDLTKRQLQDSELRLKETDAKNYKSIMEIADLRSQLKTAQRQASKVAQKNIKELEQQIQTQQRDNKKLENTNEDLRQQVKEQTMCCSNVNKECADLQRQLQQSQGDVDRLQQQLREKDSNLQQLRQKSKELTESYYTLREDYNNLQSEKNQLEIDLEDVRSKLSEVEDKTIYSDKATFDQNTANPRIAISADHTTMTTSEYPQDVAVHPGRFDVHLAALGTLGFSSGRHYWEVSVAGNICFHLGMASASAQRTGSVRFSPANGYWTILLNKQGQYRAIDRRPVTIPVATQPLTLGILLDYKKGQISFYDAGARSHMYSFVGQRFTEKIYPFVNFCSDDSQSETSIVLLDSGSTDWIK